MADKQFIKSIVQKDTDKNLSNQIDLGTTFANVVDLNTGYTLEQFFNNYMAFMTYEDGGFIYQGSTRPSVSSHIALWIDTSKTHNQ